MDYIYLRAGRVRPGGEGQDQFDFFVMGGFGGFKTNYNKKVGRGEANYYYFFYNLRPDYFFFKCESKAGRGDDPGQLKKK